MLIFLVRHAESTWNRQKKMQGQKDPPVSAYGRKEAALLARRFKGLEFAAVYSSPLKRAQGTAEIIVVGKRTKIRCEDALKEIGLGAWEGKTVTQIRRSHGESFHTWAEGPSKVVIPGGEDFRAFVARVRAALSAIEKRHTEGNVLVVCHGGVISAYLTQVLHLPADDIWCLAVRNASVTIVEVTRKLRRVVTFNDTGHLMSLQDLESARGKKAEWTYVA
jgi:broad specificity phosphatase PhoE